MSRKSTNQQYSGHITVSQQPAVPQTNPLKKNGPAAASGASPSPVAGNNNNNNNSSVSSGPRPNSGSNKKAPPLSFASAVAATVSKPNSFIANSSLPSAATPNRPVNSLPAAQPSAPNTTGKRNDSFKPSGSASAAPPSNSAVNKGVKPASSPVAVRIPQRESIAGHISNIKFGSVSQNSVQPPPPPAQKSAVGPQATSGGVPSSQPQSATKPTFGSMRPSSTLTPSSDTPQSESKPQPQQGVPHTSDHRARQQYHPRSNSFNSPHYHRGGGYHHGAAKGYQGPPAAGEFRRKPDPQRSESFSRYIHHHHHHHHPQQQQQQQPQQQVPPQFGGPSQQHIPQGQVPYMYSPQRHGGHYPHPPLPHPNQDHSAQLQQQQSQPQPQQQQPQQQQQQPMPGAPPLGQQPQQGAQVTIPMPAQGYQPQDLYYPVEQRVGSGPLPPPSHGRQAPHPPPQTSGVGAQPGGTGSGGAPPPPPPPHQPYYVHGSGSSPMQRPRDKSAPPYPIPYQMPMHQIPPAGAPPHQGAIPLTQPPPMGAIPGSAAVPGWNMHGYYGYPNIQPVHQQMYPIQSVPPGHPSYPAPQPMAAGPGGPPNSAGSSTGGIGGGVAKSTPASGGPSSTRLNPTAPQFKARETKKLQIINPETKEPISIRSSHQARQVRRDSSAASTVGQISRNATPTPGQLGDDGSGPYPRPSSQLSTATTGSGTGSKSDKPIFSLPKGSKAIKIVNPNLKPKEEQVEKKDETEKRPDTSVEELEKQPVDEEKAEPTTVPADKGDEQPSEFVPAADTREEEEVKAPAVVAEEPEEKTAESETAIPEKKVDDEGASSASPETLKPEAEKTAAAGAVEGTIVGSAKNGAKVVAEEVEEAEKKNLVATLDVVSVEKEEEEEEEEDEGEKEAAEPVTAEADTKTPPSSQRVVTFKVDEDKSQKGEEAEAEPEAAEEGKREEGEVEVEGQPQEYRILDKKIIQDIIYPKISPTELPRVIRGVVYYPIVFLRAFASACKTPPPGFDFEAPNDEHRHGQSHHRGDMRRSASGGGRGLGRGGGRNPPVSPFIGEGAGRPVPRTSEERFMNSLTATAATSASSSSLSSAAPGERGGLGLRAASGRMSQSGRESRSGRRGRGGRSRGGRAEHHEPQPRQSQAPLLPRSENRWKPSRQMEKSEEEGVLSLESVEHNIKMLLNKLTVDNFEQVSDEIIEWCNKSKTETDGRVLRHIVFVIFNKATDEPTFSRIYAQLCKKMVTEVSAEVKDHSVLTKDGEFLSGGMLVRKYLLNRCQEDFEKGWRVDMPDDIESEEYYIAAKIKRRGLGLIRFIGELFLLGMLTERIMHECVKRLLANVDDPEEEEIESLAKLMTTIGEKLERPAAKAHMDVYFGRIEALAKNKKLCSRIRFMLQDVIDLREAKWVSRRKELGPKTIAEIHEEAEKQREQTMRKSTSIRGGTSMGGHGSQFGRVGRGGDGRMGDRESRQGRSPWSTVGGGPSGSGRADSMTSRAGNLSSFGDFSRSKNSPSPGSTNPFSSLSKGSRGWNDTGSASRVGLPSARGGSALYGTSRLSSSTGASKPDDTTTPGSPTGIAKSTSTTGGGQAEKSSRTNMFSALSQHDDTHGVTSPQSGPTRAANNVPEIASTAQVPGAAAKPSGEGAPAMDPKVIKRKVKATVDEFLGLKDYEEFCECIKEIESSSHFQAITDLVEYTLTLKPSQVDLVAKAFGELRSQEVVPEDMMTRAFAEYSKQLVDIEDDIPLVYSFFASILLGSGITLDKLKEASGLASGSDSAGRTIKEYVKVLAKQDFGDDLDKAKAKISETAGIDVSVI